MDNTIDQEMIDELNKAYQIAYQYRKNTLRIRRLLDQSPMLYQECLVNAYTGQILIDPRNGYIKRSLLAS